MDELTVSIPHDQSPGRLGAYVQLFGKAAAAVLRSYSDALRQSVRGLRDAAAAAAAAAKLAGSADGRARQKLSRSSTVEQPPSPSAATASTGQQPAQSSNGTSATQPSSTNPLSHVEIAVQVQQLAFRIEHHPMEAWLALHGPILQKVVAQQSLTSRLLASLVARRLGGGDSSDSDSDSDEEAAFGGGAHTSAKAAPASELLGREAFLQVRRRA